MSRAAALFAVAAVLASCGGSETVLVTEAESLQEIHLDSGDGLEVRLVSNATTGYVWVLDDETVPDSLTLVDEEYIDPDSTVVGAPGSQVFKFDASHKGAGILRMEYVRPFDDPVIPSSIVEYIVRVDGAPWPPAGVTPAGTSSASTP